MPSTLVPTLEAFDERLAEHGLVAASAWLTSPTVGGQSWLAHGTFESGLWLARSGALRGARCTASGSPSPAPSPAPAIARSRSSRRSPGRGPRASVSASPRSTPRPISAIAGRPYNWVTMPDQYTLAALERAERAGAGAPAVRGSLADQQPCALDADRARAGGLVDDRRRQRVLAGGPRPAIRPRWSGAIPSGCARNMRARSTTCCACSASYAANFVDAHTLLILVGDHQPAPLITGEGRLTRRADPRDQRRSGAAGAVPGLGLHAGACARRPGLPPDRMDAFRDFFLDAFTAPADAAVAGSSPLATRNATATFLLMFGLRRLDLAFTLCLRDVCPDLPGDVCPDRPQRGPVNPLSTIRRQDVCTRWSMRPWESVPAPGQG